MKNSRPTFGPWSTALHDDLGEHLNSFWRQRLSSLPRVARTMPRLSRRVVFALGLIALAVSIAPTMRFATAVAKEDKASSGDGTTNAPFTYKFANGVEVELIGLSKNPSKDEPWWRPDGSPLEERPYHRVSGRMGSGLPRELCFRWKNLPLDEETPRGWHTNPHYSGAGGFAFDEHGARTSDLEGSAFSLRGDLKTCTIKFHCSVDATQWKTEFKNQADGNYKSSYKSIDGKPNGVVFGPVFHDKTSTACVISYRIPDKSVRLIGIDHEGNEHLPDPNRRAGAGAAGLWQTTFYFPGSNAKDFKRFELQTQTRTIERVEFRNVSLHPDEKTKVEIVNVSAEPKPSKQTVAIIPIPPPMPGPFNKVSYPMEHTLSANPPESWEETRKQLSERIEVLCKYLATVSQGEITAECPLLYIPADLDSPEIQELRHLHKIDERPAWLRIWSHADGLSVTNWEQGEITVADVLANVIGLKRHRIEGDTEILTEKFLGDWILRRDPRRPRAVDPLEVAAVEAALHNHLDHDVSMELKTVERPVYVARGDYRFKAIPGADGTISQTTGDIGKMADGPFLVPTRKRKIASSVAQSFKQLLEKVGEVINTPIVDETTKGPEKSVFYVRFHGQFTGEATEEQNKALDEGIERGVVENFSKQTGLTLTKENRDVQILMIKLD